MKTTETFTNVEKLIMLIAEAQKFSRPKDKLAALIDRYSDHMSEELSEDELMLAAAAKMPDVPKYKLLQNNM